MVCIINTRGVSIMKSMMKLAGIIALAALIGFSMESCKDHAPENNGGDDDFVPVTNIIDVKTYVLVGTISIGGKVVPSDATHKTIGWKIEPDGDNDEGATISPGGVLTTTEEGLIKVLATIMDGKAEGEPYTQKFSITVYPFVAVTDIVPGFPVKSKVGELILDGHVKPNDASYLDIVWSIKDPDTTRATLRENVLTTRAVGTVRVTATIKKGLAQEKDYTQDFSIEIVE